MSNYTRQITEERKNIRRRLLLDAQQRQKERTEVVFRIDATSEVRVKVKSGGACETGVQARSASTGRFVATESPFINYGKPQDFESEQKEVVSRARSLGLTQYARQTIRAGCAVLKELFGKKVAFITLTLPGGSRRALDAAAGISRYLLNLFTQNLRDLSKKTFLSSTSKSLPSNSEESALTVTEIIDHYVGVWEWQKRGALHIHLAVGIESSAVYNHVKRSVKRWWYRALKKGCEKTGIDLFEKVDGSSWKNHPEVLVTECKRVKKDIRYYMSKYISKGGLAPGSDEWGLPGKWWFISNALIEKVKARIVVDVYEFRTREEAEALVRRAAKIGMERAENYVEWKNPFNERWIGYIMYFTEKDKINTYIEMSDVVEFTDVGDVLSPAWFDRATGEVIPFVGSEDTRRKLMYDLPPHMVVFPHAELSAPSSS